MATKQLVIRVNPDDIPLLTRAALRLTGRADRTALLRPLLTRLAQQQRDHEDAVNRTFQRKSREHFAVNCPDDVEWRSDNAVNCDAADAADELDDEDDSELDAIKAKLKRAS
jgi:hypothetical protein